MSSEHFTDEDRATVEALAWAMSYLPPGWKAINTRTHVAVPVDDHAAAEPVDTTEFEDVANRLIDAAMTLQAAQHGSEIERQATIDVDKRVDALVDLYVKAATR